MSIVECREMFQDENNNIYLEKVSVVEWRLGNIYGFEENTVHSLWEHG